MQAIIAQWQVDGLTLREGYGVLPNVHLGVSVEDQATADERIPLLLQTPAAKRFVSIEPCLSSLDLLKYLKPKKGGIYNEESRSGIYGIDGDRCVFCGQSGEGLEAQEDGGRQPQGHSSDRENLKNGEESRNKQGGLSDDNVHIERQTDEGLRPSNSMDAPQPIVYPDGHGNKPQGWQQEQSSSIKPRTGYEKPEHETQFSRVAKKKEISEGRSQHQRKADQRTSVRNPAALQGETNSAIENCKDVRDSSSHSICNLCRQELESHSVKLDGVILGGETGRGARPMHPDWPRKVRDDCKAAGVPFFFKQWGEWAPVHPKDHIIEKDRCLSPDGTWDTWVEGMVCFFNESEGCQIRRVGKKAAGHLLDGVEHRDLI